jgi:hypothetical protein
MIAVDTCKAKVSTVQSTGGPDRHWSPESQSYASGDILMNFLRSGWVPEHLVAVETFYFSDCRHVNVFRFRLTKGEQTLTIPVVANPIIRRLIKECRIDCFPISQHHLKPSRIDDLAFGTTFLDQPDPLT